jgi:hypothetical protein
VRCILDDNDLPCLTSGSTFFALRETYYYLQQKWVCETTPRRSLASPKMMPRLVWGLVGASTVPPLARTRHCHCHCHCHRPQSPARRPRSPLPPFTSPFRRARPSPPSGSRRVPTYPWTHVTPTSCAHHTCACPALTLALTPPWPAHRRTRNSDVAMTTP